MQPGATVDPGIPATMRAALLVGHGGPDKLVVRGDVAVPTLAPDEVLIRVSACGVNNTDINTRIGWYNRSEPATTAIGVDSGAGAGAGIDAWGDVALTFPRIQGADICGRVVATGDAVDDVVVGRRVLVDPIRRDPLDPFDRDRCGYLGSEFDGGFAEFACVPAANVHPVESELSDVELATFACSGGAAEHMLQRAGVRRGETVVVTGASGGVGTMLVQLATRRGARVIAVAGRDKAVLVSSLGADAVVARESDDLRVAVLAAAGGPIDVVADVVGGAASFTMWLDILRRGGRYVTAGAIAGPLVALDLRTLYLKDLSLTGATVFGPDLFAGLVGSIERADVRAIVARVFPLEQIHAAQQFFAEKRHVGNVVIDLGAAR